MNPQSEPGAGTTAPAVRTRPAQREVLGTIAICVALAVGTIALYCPVLWHGFINYDDPDYILNNPHVNTGLTRPGIVWAFTHAYAANWHPLTWISHMMDCQMFDLHPGGHHLINVLFHAANTVLLFVLLNDLTRARWRSAFVAALFGWHPLHVESVAWASERKDVLSAFFWMLTLLCYARYALGKAESSSSSESSGRNPSPFQFLASPACWLALFFFACGLMSKPMVVTLPFVLLLLDFWPLQRVNASTLSPRQSLAKAGQRLIAEKIPFFVLVAASCAVTLSVQHNAMWSSASLPFPFRIANTVMSYVRYLSKIFLPTNLALIYPYPHSWPQASVVISAGVLCLLTAVSVLQAKRSPYLAVGWFWFLGTLVPVIGLVQVGVQSMADRYTYLPSIGIFILVTWGFSDLVASLARKMETCAMAGAAALIACLVLTSVQLRYWRSDLALFSHTVAVTTDNYAADDCLGKTLHNLGFPKQAQLFYDEAIQLEPDYPLAQFDAGINLLSLNDPTGASNHLATAVQLWPGNAVMQYDFGVFLSQHGRPKDAAAHLQAALAIQPDFPQARRQLDALKH
ncbi:MAG TPA: tetratricopeptide repeat protein [Verrucomicrobiae bacterium]|nr:tetratricopeptide repeat protein [Verrucomicrobiae bacterium]